MTSYWKFLMVFGLVLLLLKGYNVYIGSTPGQFNLNSPTVPDTQHATTPPPPPAGELLIGFCTLDKQVISRADGEELLTFLFFLLASIAVLIELGIETLGRLTMIYHNRH